MCGWVQDAMQFVGKVAYHDFGGVADEEEEMELVSKAVKGGADVLVLRNHGILVLGEDTERAFSRLYYYERACQCQLLVMVCFQDTSFLMYTHKREHVYHRKKAWFALSGHGTWSTTYSLYLYIHSVSVPPSLSSPVACEIAC